MQRVTRAALTLLAAGTVCLALASCTSGAATPTTPTPTTYPLRLSVSAAPQHGTSGAYENACQTYRLEQAAVTVRDEHGTVIATGTTGANVRPEPTPLPDDERSWLSTTPAQAPSDAQKASRAEAFRDEDLRQRALHACLVTVTAAVPRAQYYQFLVGTHGTPAYGFDQLQQQGWAVDLAL
jgi:hypothetical protein